MGAKIFNESHQLAGVLKPEPFKVQVFKTSVKSTSDIEKIKPHLDSFPGLTGWSIDNEDCDNVLRAAGSNLQAEKIKTLLMKNGFTCEELP